MNKKLLILTLLFMLFSVSFVSARMCDTDNVLDILRKALYIYYMNPDESSFTPEELKDLLGFYVGIQSGQITVECTAQSDNVDKANALPDTIPSCSDGTKYGKCSNNKPMYCYAGRLVPRCRLCGCPTNQWCDITYVDTSKGNKGQWGKCNPGTNITCVIDNDCGTSGYTGNYYCKELNVYKNYTKHTCLNPGEINSDCKTETLVILIDDCQTGEQCLEGQAECQTIPSNQTCTDGTPYGQCSTTKPKYCDNGALINKCQTCGCETGKICRSNGNCEIPTCSETEPTTNMLSSNFAIFNAAACLDGTLGPTGGTYCLHDSPTDGWLKIDLGTGNEQEYTKTRFYGSSQPSPATQFQIQYSDDGTNWNTVGTITMPVSSTNTWHELSWASVGPHRYWQYKYLTGWRSPVLHEIEWYTPNCQPQTCSDGTAYGQCSTTKPKYCDNGVLVDKCQTCGCSTGTCQGDGSCSVACGTVIHSFDVPSGVNDPACGIIYFGDYLWIGDLNGNVVRKVDPVSGAVVYSYTHSYSNAGGLAYNPNTNLIYHLKYPSGPIFVINGNNFEAVSSYSTSSIGSWLHDITFDGTYLWVTRGDSISNVQRAYKFDLSTNKALGSFKADITEGNLIGIVWDGSHIWLTEGTKLYKINQEKSLIDGTCEGNVLLQIENLQAGRLAWENPNYIWTMNSSKVMKIDVSNCEEICMENWQCTGWSSCINGQETRTCTDSNACGTIANKPAEVQSCGVSKAYRKARWSWQATFDYNVNIQYSDDKFNWYDATQCSHVRFREEMDRQAQTWNDVGAHKYWALHVCGTAGTPPFQIWEMDWFTYDGANYVEENPAADKISFEGSYTSFDASKLIDNNLDTLGLQKDNINEARLILS